MSKQAAKAKDGVPAERGAAPGPALVLERTFDATPQQLWDAWTIAEQYAQWLNPSPADLVIQEWDLRVGGRIRFLMPQPDGNDNPQEGVFHELDPPRRLVSGNEDRTFLLEATFEPVDARGQVAGNVPPAGAGEAGSTRTKLRIVVHGVPPDWHAAAREGWGQGLDKLARLIRLRQATAGAPEETMIRRYLDATPEAVFAALTDTHAIGQWWGPEGFTTTTQSADIRTGGHWQHIMHGPDGTDYPNYAKYLEVTPPRRLVYDHGVSADTPAWFRATMEVEPAGAGSVVTLRHRHPDQATRDRLNREVGAVEGGHQTLGRLAGHLEQHALTIERLFAAPPEKVWHMWTDPEAVRQWWGPEGISCPGARMDVRVGGTSVIGMRMPDGKDVWGCSTYMQIVQHRRLVMTDRFCDADGNPVPPSAYGMLEGHPEEMVIVVEFEPAGQGTRMRLRHEGVASGKLKQDMEQGWSQMFDKLRAATG